MTLKHYSLLTLLAAIWGASFLLMRVSVPEFGAVPMMFLRVLIAGLALMPIMYFRKRQQQMYDNLGKMTLVGLFNSAIPFSLIAFSTIYVTAGFASVLNAATPMCAALIAFLWFGVRLSRIAVIGLIIGLLGVLILVWDKIGINAEGDQWYSTLAILAGLGGALSYGIAANLSKKHLAGISPMVSTIATQLAAAIILLPLAILWWPKENPSVTAWVNLLALALVCTGFAQILYFKLIEETGAANATTVTFLIPIFGLIWGSVFLAETIPLSTLIACVVILFGVSLTTGLLNPDRIKSKFKSKAKTAKSL